MRAKILQISGALILFACMAFAIAKFESADKWISVWIPFVVAGVALALVGAITNKGSHSGRHT